MNAKFMGGVLLVTGTTIGAGILALPIVTAELGFWGSLVLLITSWAIMTASAFVFLEVNLWLPPKSNLISMAGATLGKPGQSLTWVVYLMLLYSILCAYIAGGADLCHYLLSTAGIPISISMAAILFTVLFAIVVYFGMRSVDYVNRGLMFGKMGAYVLLVTLMLPFISANHLGNGEFKHIVSPTGISVTVLAFSSIMIIPSLRTYFGEDIKTLRKVIFIGMLIPLFCYIVWDMVIMGIIPLEGKLGLKRMLHSSSSSSDLLIALSSLIQKNTVTVFAKFFTSICMATSFLSVSLCLSDFLSDGLRVPKKGRGNIVIYGATFLPPILIVLFYPDVFIRCLKYAGMCCLVLMILLPPAMAWYGRYRYALGRGYQEVRGGKYLLALLMLFATLLVIGSGFESAV